MYRKCKIPGFLEDKVWADMTGKRYDKGVATIIQRLRDMEETR